MTDVRVRGVDDQVVHDLKAQAQHRGQTLGQMLIEVLTETAARPRRELAAELRAFREDMRAQYGEMPDSTPMIREERDRWG